MIFSKLHVLYRFDVEFPLNIPLIKRYYVKCDILQKVKFSKIIYFSLSVNREIY